MIYFIVNNLMTDRGKGDACVMDQTVGMNIKQMNIGLITNIRSMMLGKLIIVRLQMAAEFNY